MAEFIEKYQNLQTKFVIPKMVKNDKQNDIKSIAKAMIEQQKTKNPKGGTK